MNADDLIGALHLPTQARVDQRVPKKLLVEHGAPTSADRRRINDGIEEVHWVAALKPNTIGVPAFRDSVREYLEIAVLTMVLRSASKATRLTELIHRAVPYPLILFSVQDGAVSISVAHKRRSLGESGQTVLDGEVVTADLDKELKSDIMQAFIEALALNQQPRSNMYTLYQGWLDTVTALCVAKETGVFRLSASEEETNLRLKGLHECSRLENKIVHLRATAAKEKQTSRLVDMNLEIQSLQGKIASIRNTL